MTDERKEPGWHIDKRVSIGHIVTTLVVAVSLVVWLGRIEKNVELNAQAIVSQRERTDWVERSVREDQAEIKSTLREIYKELRALTNGLNNKADR